MYKQCFCTILFLLSIAWTDMSHERNISLASEGLKSPKMLAEIKLHRRESLPALSVTWLAFSPNGNYLSARFGTGDRVDNLAVWSSPAWDTFSARDVEGVTSYMSSSTMGTCCYSLDSSSIYYINKFDVATISLADNKGDTIAKSIGAKTVPIISLYQNANNKDLFCAVIAPSSGDYLFVEHWSIGKRKKVHSIQIEHTYGTALSPVCTWSHLAFAGSDLNDKMYKTFICDLNEQSVKLKKIHETKRGISCIAISTNNKYVAIGELDGTLSVVSTFDGKIIYSAKQFSTSIQHIEFSNNTDYLIASSCDKNSKSNVMIVDVALGKECVVFCGCQKGILRCNMSSNKKMLSAFCLDNTIKIWDVREFIK